MDIQNHIVVYGKKGNREFFLGYPRDDSLQPITKKDLFCYPKTEFKFYAPVPQAEINALRAPVVNNLNKPRLFATLTLEPMQSASFTRFLNTERFLNIEAYRQYFQPYLNDDGTTIKPEFLEGDNLNFCMNISEFKRIYTQTSLENNAEKSTYAMTKSLYTPAANGTVAGFEDVRLLAENWKELAHKLKNTGKSLQYKRPIGKSSRFLYKDAAGNLFQFVERFLKSLGFTMIFLDADTMSLAVKIYGRDAPGGGYFPLWDKKTKKDATGLILDGYKVSGVVNSFDERQARQSLAALPANLRSLIDCDSSSGPSMFKIIQEGVATPVYNWDADKAACVAATTAVRAAIAAPAPAPPAPAPPAPAPPAPAPPAPAPPAPAPPAPAPPAPAPAPAYGLDPRVQQILDMFPGAEPGLIEVYLDSGYTVDAIINLLLSQGQQGGRKKHTRKWRKNRKNRKNKKTRKQRK